MCRADYGEGIRFSPTQLIPNFNVHDTRLFTGFCVPVYWGPGY